MSFENLSLIDAASAIRSGSLSPVDYVQALLARIDLQEPRIHAWTTIDRDAVLFEATQCAEEARRKEFRGPLHGVPVGIKDIFFTRGLRTTLGSPVFDHFVPAHDARVVTKLKEAGAIVLGKTVTTMFANLDPGPTRNPWNVERTPGGSSSGSAAAVAARMCPAAIGSQTVGSVGRPASFCGIASLVPPQRQVSLKNVFPLAWSLDHVGIFARSVADLELMRSVIGEMPVAAPVDALPDRATFRVGVVRAFFHENATPEMGTSVEGLVRELASCGFEVGEAVLPAIFHSHQEIMRPILQSETAAIHKNLFPRHRETYGPKIRALIESGLEVRATDYARAVRLRRRYQRDMAKLFKDFDVLLTPAACGTAPGIESTGDPMMNAPWTLSDFPIATLPNAAGADGLPLAVQIIAAPLQEGMLLKAAHAIEGHCGNIAKHLFELNK